MRNNLGTLCGIGPCAYKVIEMGGFTDKTLKKYKCRRGGDEKT